MGCFKERDSVSPGKHGLTEDSKPWLLHHLQRKKQSPAAACSPHQHLPQSCSRNLLLQLRGDRNHPKEHETWRFGAKTMGKKRRESKLKAPRGVGPRMLEEQGTTELHGEPASRPRRRLLAGKPLGFLPRPFHFLIYLFLFFFFLCEAAVENLKARIIIFMNPIVRAC